MTTNGMIDNVRAADRSFPFNSGEKLIFELKWMFIPAGEAVMEVLPMENEKGISSYHFVLTAQSNAFIDQFYKVRDRIDAYVDLGMTHSLLYKKKQHEGKTQRDIVVNFNWEKLQALYSNFGNSQEPIDLFPGSFDPLSAFFYVRLFELNKKLTIERPITDGKKCVIGKVTVIKRETIKVTAGTFDTYLIEPEVKDIGGVFEKSKGAKIQIWLTADHRHLPVKIRSQVAVGSFTGELVSATGLKE
ncbi:MAG: DUF3108 domain-containing protein [Proteobacteria bacterium]|nr:DUF3108 domain-containing protein [Pseudomonadota bacterium]